MQQNIQKYIKEIESRKNKIKALNEKVRDITDFLEMENSPYKKEITKAKEEIELIKRAKIHTSFKEIVKNLAKHWEVSSNDLFISYKTSADFKSFADQYASIKADKFNASKAKDTSDITVTFTISTMPSDIKDLRSESFTSKINLQAPQMDGKPFYQHITTKPAFKSNSITKIVTVIDNLDQIVVTNRFGDLIYEDFIDGVHAKDLISQMIIDASNSPIPEPEKVPEEDTNSNYIIELD